MKVFDRDGNELADLAISEKQQNILEANEKIVVLFHTPQLFRGLLGERTGSFMLRKIDDRIVATDTASVAKYAELMRAVKAVREQP